MKILIIGSSFYPENSPRSIRTTELVKEFAKQGHRVTVLIPKENIHLQFEKEHQVEIKNLGINQLKDINIVSGGKVLIVIKRILRRSLNLIFYYPKIEWMFKVKKALKKEKGYHLLISIAAPHSIHWGVAWAWKKNNTIAKTWIADCGDPFMGLESDTFKKMFYFKYLEKSWGKRANFITIPIEEAVKSYYSEFHKKIVVIPQGFSFPKLEKKKKNSIPTFVYSGNIESYRHYYMPFFNFIKKIESDFKFIIFTKEKHIYEKELSNIKDKIEINNYIEREDLIQVLYNADFLIHFPYQNDTQRSLKLVDYGYTNTPILSYTAKNEDNEKVLQFLRSNYEGKYNAGDIEKYTIKNVTENFLKLTQ